MMGYFEEFGTKELILVVGDNQPSSSADIVFVPPRGTPAEVLSDVWWNRFCKPRTAERSKFVFDDSLSWQMLEEEAMHFLRDYQSARAEARQKLSEGMFKSHDPYG
jgi:hypothetical protein